MYEHVWRMIHFDLFLFPRDGLNSYQCSCNKFSSFYARAGEILYFSWRGRILNRVDFGCHLLLCFIFINFSVSDFPQFKKNLKNLKAINIALIYTNLNFYISSDFAKQFLSYFLPAQKSFNFRATSSTIFKKRIILNYD